MSRKRKVVADEDEDPTKIDFETSEEVDVVPTFDQLRLREDLLRGVYAYGTYVTPCQLGMCCYNTKSFLIDFLVF